MGLLTSGDFSESEFKDGQAILLDMQGHESLVLNIMFCGLMDFPGETRTNAYSYQFGHQGYTKETVLSKSTLKDNEFIVYWVSLEEHGVVVVLKGHGNSKTDVPLKSSTPAWVTGSGNSIMESCLHIIF